MPNKKTDDYRVMKTTNGWKVWNITQNRWASRREFKNKSNADAKARSFKS